MAGDEDRTGARAYSCVGSDGRTYKLTETAMDGAPSFVLDDGSRVVRLSKGAYKAVGRPLYLWCNESDAP